MESFTKVDNRSFQERYKKAIRLFSDNWINWTIDKQILGAAPLHEQKKLSYGDLMS